MNIFLQAAAAVFTPSALFFRREKHLHDVPQRGPAGNGIGGG